MSTITISNALHYPFDAKVHPDRKLISEHSNRWISSHGLVPPGWALERLKAIDGAGLAAHACPHATLEAAKLAADWIVWLYVLDDIVDERDVNVEYERLKGFLDRLHRTYSGASEDHARDAPGSAQLHRSLAELRRRVEALGGAAYVEWHASVLGDFFASLLWEKRNRMSRVTPDLKSYAENRIHTGGIMLMFALLDVSSPVEGVAELWADPHVKELTCSAGRVVCWLNDLLSYEREANTEGIHNMVFVLERHENMSRDAAIERSIAIHNEEVARFLRLCEKGAPSMDAAQVRGYASALKAWIRGCFDWSVNSGYRYKDAPHPSSRRGSFALLERHKHP